MFAVLLAVLGGCATVDTRPQPASAEQAGSDHPVLRQATELARVGTTLNGAAYQANAARIDALLSQLDDATLAREATRIASGDPLYNYVGRALLRRGLPLPRPFDRVAWQFDASTRPPAQADGYRPPMDMAVLLPLSGDLSAAAAPVRDGFLAGYYGEQRRRPEVEFYDTRGTPAGALAAYDQAVADGHDFVLGPLGRDEVSALFGRGQLPVATLALNRGTLPPPPGNASFSLSPEDEGIAAAEYLLDRGATRVLAVVGNDDSLRRATQALREHLGERGVPVTVTRIADYNRFAPAAEAGDTGSGASLSMPPAPAPAPTVATAPPVDPASVDAVFLAVRGSAAHALMPRLSLAGLAGKPMVATSQLLSGTGAADQDRVLDGIAFPTAPWTSGQYVRGLPAATSVGERLPTARGAAARLFAFGHDAWLLTAYLEQLALQSDGRIAGATGTLRIDGFGNIQRTPAWSTFSGGRVVPLTNAGGR